MSGPKGERTVGADPRVRPWCHLAGTLLLALAACAEPATDDDGFRPDPVPEKGEIVFTATPVRTTVPLGEDLVLRCRIENRSTVKARVNEPQLSSDSVSFRVRTAAFDVAWVERTRVRESENGVSRLAPVAKELEAGGSLEKDVPVVAVLAGKWTLVPVYRFAGFPAITAPPVEVEVTAQTPGDRLGFRMETSHGPLAAVLRPDVAFNTCESFASLVRSGFYDGLPFHRVVKGFMAQGGAPGGLGWNGPGWQIKRELSGGRLLHRRGTFAMARGMDPNSAGSQFYVCLAPQPNLDKGGYATFAEMVEGESTLARLEKVGHPVDGPPSEPVTIKKATLFTVPAGDRVK